MDRSRACIKLQTFNLILQSSLSLSPPLKIIGRKFALCIKLAHDLIILNCRIALSCVGGVGFCAFRGE